MWHNVETISEELTGYKETNKANQKWSIIYGDEEF